MALGHSMAPTSAYQPVNCVKEAISIAGYMHFTTHLPLAVLKYKVILATVPTYQLPSTRSQLVMGLIYSRIYRCKVGLWRTRFLARFRICMGIFKNC